MPIAYYVFFCAHGNSHGHAHAYSHGHARDYVHGHVYYWQTCLLEPLQRQTLFCHISVQKLLGRTTPPRQLWPHMVKHLFWMLNGGQITFYAVPIFGVLGPFFKRKPRGLKTQGLETIF